MVEMSLLQAPDQSRSVDKLLCAVAEIEGESAQDAKAVQFMARVFVQVTFPHSKPIASEIERSNGAVHVSMMAPARIGLPYGSIPRLVLAWLSTEAKLKKSRDLCLGDSFSDFMKKVGLLEPGRGLTGGRNGSLRRIKEQCRRLFATTITYIGESSYNTRDRRFSVSDDANLWWEPIDSAQRQLFRSTVRLSETFFEEVIRSSVPVDFRALRALKRSPLALDIYMWLTYRVFRLTTRTVIPWPSLQRQFGAGYPDTARGRVDFRQNFRRALGKVEMVYQTIQGRVRVEDRHLVLLPARSHVRAVAG